MHFILYYAYYPKIPFVFNTSESILFGSFYGKNYRHVELSFPFENDPESSIDTLHFLLTDSSFASLIKDTQVTHLLLRDLNENMVHILRTSKDAFQFQLLSLRELCYKIYNVRKTLDKKGKDFANLRWHLNKFQKDNHTVESVPITEALKPVIHLIGSWKRTAIQERGFSYINVRSDKQAARLFNDIPERHSDTRLTGNSPRVNDCILRVLKVDGQIRSFNFGYPLGIYEKKDVFAHAVGITDLSIPHLAEFAQYDFWKKVHEDGYFDVNDGPSWKQSLERYKQKFRPIATKRYYYATFILK